MTDLEGVVRIPKRMLDMDLLNDRPATPYQALVDLWRWANDRDRTVVLNGKKTALKRGQLARSQTSLGQAWRRDREWAKNILVRFQEEGLVTFEGGSHCTIITVLDYEVYNPCSLSTSSNESRSGSSSISGNESRSGSSSISGTEGEVEVEDQEGERAREALATPADDSETIPSDEEVGRYCGAFLDLARGVTGGIPEIWWRDWLAMMLTSQKSFRRWRESLRQKFLADFQNSSSPGFAKIHGAPAASVMAGSGGKKNGAQLISLERQLEVVRQRMDHQFNLNQPVAPADRELERELKRQVEQMRGAA